MKRTTAVRSGAGGSKRWRWWVLWAAAACAAAGCARRAEQGAAETAAARQAGQAGGSEGRDHLALALDFLERLDEFEPGQATSQLCYQLNRWLEEETPPAGWSPDPLVQKLPPAFRRYRPVALESLSQRRFPDSDAQYLRETLWMRNLARWVSRKPACDIVWTPWFERAAPQLGAAAAGRLAVAHRLFDWTVRNIQLDPLLPYPKPPEAGPTADGRVRTKAPPPAPLRGEPGPGYRFPPRDVLQWGRGDAWQRARVFILLARQADLDAVMLAVDEPLKTPRYQPWLPAVLIEGELYLFDAALGLPLPGPDGRGAATLSQVLDDPGLLRRLDVGRRPYPIQADQLGRLVALIDAAPESLSLRMRMLEARLTGARRLALTVSPSDLAKRVRACRGVGGVHLWTIPIEAQMYQEAFADKLRRDPETAIAHFEQAGVFFGFNPLVQARALHFQGRFDRTDDEPGAKSRYMEVRLPEEALGRLETSPVVQRRLGLEQQRGESPEAFAARLRQAYVLQRAAKRNATYWIGLVHYETGNYEAAVRWLRDRVLQADPDGPWTEGARYNLGRCYEALDQIGPARQLYLEDDSPQRRGNRLRAEMLAPLETTSAAGADAG